MEISKIPAHDKEVEMAVLSAVMTEKGAIDEVIGKLKSEDFYDNKNEIIYSTIVGLHSTSSNIDVLTIMQALRKSNNLELAGGPFYLNELTSKVNSAGHIHSHAAIISEFSLKRKICKYASVLHQSSFNNSISGTELLEEANSLLTKITNNIATNETFAIKEILTEVMDGIGKAMSLPDGITGVPSGFTDVDAITGGWQNSDFIIIAARPGIGKTSFAVNNMRNTAVKFGKPVAFFSLEMSRQQLVTRMVASEVDELNLTTSRLTRGRISDEDYKFIHQKINSLANSKIFIDDTPGLSLSSLRIKATKLKRDHNIEEIIVDYLQLMVGSKGKGNREQEISEISRGLKILAKELQIPVIALSQLSRAVEQRGGDKRPQLSDLRESGSLEQDADLVAFLYRPEYYKIMEDSEGRSLKGIGELIIAKHRNGALEDVPLRFIAGKTKFTDLREEYTEVSSVQSFLPFPSHAFTTNQFDEND